MKLPKLLISATIIAIALTGCFKQKVLREQEEVQIKEFIAELGQPFYLTPNGVYYHIDSLGRGACIREGDSVMLVYTGYNLDENEKVFVENDTIFLNVDDPLLLEGWREIFYLLPRGTYGKAIFPYYTAYNKKQVTTIPPYSTLYFVFYFE